MTAWKSKALVGLMLLAATMPAGSGWAHHSNSQFDIGRRVQVKGTVRRFQWSNPHVWLYVEVGKDGKSEIWGFEGTSPNVLKRLGWHADLLQVGEKVTITGAPTRDGRKIAMLNKVKLANGRELRGIPEPEGFSLPDVPVSSYN